MSLATITGYLLCKSFLKLISLDFQSDTKMFFAFNIGINDGPDAGRSVHHLHIHLIPRRPGDIQNPQGGVRGVIPSKQKYTKKDLKK